MPGRLDLPCVTLRTLIRAAYGSLTGDEIAARSMQVLGGPSWLDSDRFDITAKAPERASTTRMVGPMLQTLLEDRFQLKLHVEARETPVYALTVGKSGPKLTPAKPESCVPIDLNNPEQWHINSAAPCGFPKMSMKGALATLEIAGTTMEEFAGRTLPPHTDRPVIDKTGLTGRYDIHLEFAREPRQVFLNGVPQPAPPAGEIAGPSIFTALQEQLGLKLSPDKAPLNVLVIDSVQKPTEN
jgi:uncharacterized protein (TIGR03435 family)